MSSLTKGYYNKKKKIHLSLLDKTEKLKYLKEDLR